MEGVRVAYTLEQCWHRVPGGTAVSAIEVARAMPMVRADVELLGVSGKHGEDSAVTFDISIDVAGLPVSGPLLYEASLRLRQPRVERVLSDIDLLHNAASFHLRQKRKWCQPFTIWHFCIIPIFSRAVGMRCLHAV